MMDSEFISAFLKKNDLRTIHEEEHDKWLKVNPFNLKPVQVADIRPFTYEKKEETPLVEFKMPELHEKLVEGINREFDKLLKNKRLRQHADLMDTVLYAKFATDKVAEDEMEKKCINCRYHHEWCCDINRPCRNCDIDYNKWEPKEEKMTNSYIEEKIKYVERKLLPFVSMNDMSMTLLYDSLCDSFSLSVRKGKIGREYRIEKAGAYKKEYFVGEFVKMIERDFVIIKRPSDPSVPSIKNVIFNDPATIIFWTDGTKTVVKAQDEAYDPEKGMAMAIAKKALGNQGNYCNVFKKWLPEEVETVFDRVSFNEAVEAVKKISEKLKARKEEE